MKNAPLGKRRDRRTSLSPYARHGKREYLYSAGYRAWKARTVREHGGRVNQQHAQELDGRD